MQKLEKEYSPKYWKKVSFTNQFIILHTKNCQKVGSLVLILITYTMYCTAVQWTRLSYNIKLGFTHPSQRESNREAVSISNQLLRALWTTAGCLWLVISLWVSHYLNLIKTANSDLSNAYIKQNFLFYFHHLYSETINIHSRTPFANNLTRTDDIWTSCRLCDCARASVGRFWTCSLCHIPDT